MSQINAVRNEQGIWINVNALRGPAIHFEKYGSYNSDPYASPAWFDHWSEERKRCIKGFEVGGVKITGNHYRYLNYSPINKVENTASEGNVARKTLGFPDFWDGDYNYFWSRDIARFGLFNSLLSDEELKAFDKEDEMKAMKLYDSLFLSVKIPYKTEIKLGTNETVVKKNLEGGFNIIVGKSRRKGYSLKSRSVAVNNYYTKPNSFTAFAAYEKKFLYPGAIFTYATDDINFINTHTGWAMPSDVINKADHIKASYIEYKNGIKLEGGFKSEIQAVTFKDNADALRGKNAEDIFFEESGAFGTPGLLIKSYKATEDCVMAGNKKTGMITIFGTSGDMGGGTYDYADMFSRPEAFGLMPFNNIWDKDSEDHKVGFFHPINWNMEGFYDKNGNSDEAGARLIEEKERGLLIAAGATSQEIQQRMQEKPLGPAEAFSAISNNTMPVVELKAQLRKVIANGWQMTKGTPVELSMTGVKVDVKPILNGTSGAITSYFNIPTNKKGCPIIYEFPIANAPKGLYKIGYDPVRQDSGSSLCSIIVYKSSHLGSYYGDIVVAEYVGRYDDTDLNDRMAEMLARLYNTTIMHENEVTSVKNYFRRNKMLSLLALQPDNVISKNVKKSKVARVYGCHMTTQLKDAGIRYIKTWLMQVIDYDENGDPIRVIDRIYSIRLLEELINYNTKGNFDLVSALIMCLFQVQEESLNKEYGDEEDEKAKRMKKYMESLKKRA